MLHVPMLLNNVRFSSVLYSVEDPLHPCRNGKVIFLLNFLLTFGASGSACSPSVEKKKSLLKTTASASACSPSHLTLTEEDDLLQFPSFQYHIFRHKTSSSQVSSPSCKLTYANKHLGRRGPAPKLSVTAL